MIDLGALSRPTVLEDGWRKLLADLYREAGGEEHYDPLRESPEAIFAAAGMGADAWQKRLLRGKHPRRLVCNSRQIGKSQVAAAAVLEAVLNPPATVLIISRTLRQSSEVKRKVDELYAGLRSAGAARRKRKRFNPVSVQRAEELERRYEAVGLPSSVRDSILSKELDNGSRIISLPGKAEGFVGYTPDLLIIDEAARVPDDTYRQSRPFLATSGGRLLALSTPFGKRGWFYEEWARCEDAKARGQPEPWERYQVKVTECSRISADFLKDERLALGERWFNQEYLCSFEDAVGAVFTHDVIHGMIDKSVEALW